MTYLSDKQQVRLWLLLGLSAMVLGGLLRLLWPQDMEYKRDEAWMFYYTQEVGRTEPFPWLGMPSSFDIRHPGGSIWVFLGLGKLFGVTAPEELGLACQLTNVAAIVLLVVFAWWSVRPQERETWLWAALLVAVNPLAMVLHRKIWSPSIMPLFTMLFLIGWWYRGRRGGAFLWGLLGVLMGQVHPVGLFLAAGFFLWALLFERRSFSWRWWLLGSLLGALTLLPWFHYVFTEMAQQGASQRRWAHLAEGKIWLRWFTEPLGMSLSYTLDQGFADFLRFPLIAGRPTYLVAALHLVMFGAGLLVVSRGLAGLARRRGQWWEWWTGRESATAFTQSAALWGFGIIFTATLLPIHRHYLVITFPLMFLWVARSALVAEAGRPMLGIGGRPLLATLCLAQFLVSLSFLGFIHSLQGPLQAEYGTPYRVQRLLNNVTVFPTIGQGKG